MPSLPDPLDPTNTAASPIVRLAEPSDVPGIRQFLEAYRETSLFLLSNLDEVGIRVTSAPTTGNFGLIEEAGRLVGVFCLTRKGDLLAQTGARTDLVPSILRACDDEPFPISGVLAEWHLADALWDTVQRRPGFLSAFIVDSVVYRRDGWGEPVAGVPGLDVRPLGLDEFQIWEPLDRAFHESEGLAVPADDQRRRASYTALAGSAAWWGAFAADDLIATACANVVYRGTVQLGGVYTRPDWRRRGVSRLVMSALMRHHHRTHGVNGAVLFTAVGNGPARALYESMGFSACGRFGLMFGRWVEPGR